MFLKIEDCSTVYLNTHKYRKDTNCRKMLSFVIIFYGMVLRALHLNALVFDDFSGMHFFFFFLNSPVQQELHPTEQQLWCLICKGWVDCFGLGISLQVFIGCGLNHLD